MRYDELRFKNDMCLDAVVHCLNRRFHCPRYSDFKAGLQLCPTHLPARIFADPDTKVNQKPRREIAVFGRT